MRITFCCPHIKVAGGVRAILTYADRLTRLGHEVAVVVPAKGAIKAWWWNLHRVRPEWISGFLPRVWWVPRWSSTGFPDGDALVATSWQSAPPVHAAPSRCGKKFYLIQHYESLYHAKPDGTPETVDATYRLPLRKIVISTWLRDIIRQRFSSDADVLVTPVDTALFSRVEVGHDDGLVRILMLHHHYPWKGVADGLEAFEKVKARHPKARLVGFGLKRPKPQLPYDEYHENLPQERLRWLYGRCQIYLCPSWDEGLGMPSMEAMACGAALVTYDNGGCRDYALDGQTALVARRRDVDDLARQLERLVADPGLREKIAREGEMFVSREFDWERAVAQIEALFEE